VYKVQAYDEVPNYGANSSATSGIPQDTIAPASVSITSITPIATGNALSISWSSSSSSDVAGYRLYNGTLEAGPYTLLTTTGALETSHTHSDLIDGQTQWYRVAPIDEVPNEGTNSTAASGVPADTTAPTQVTGLGITVVATGNALTLAWDASAAPDFDHYNIYRSNISSLGPFQLIITRATNSYIDSGLVDGNTYYYKVSAVDDGIPTPNEGANSTVISAAPSDTTAPPVVTGVMVWATSEITG